MEAQEAASQNTQYKIQLQEIVAPLLEWYAANARALPWRENTDPYRVWGFRDYAPANARRSS